MGPKEMTVETKKRTVKEQIVDLVDEATGGFSARSKNSILKEIKRLAKDI